jgi:hypothetical protein
LRENLQKLVSNWRRRKRARDREGDDQKTDMKKIQTLIGIAEEKEDDLEDDPIKDEINRYKIKEKNKSPD